MEESAHFIALHEQRASFPLESSAGRGEVGYPGMHSDVGGGYEPGEQGKAMPSWGQSPQLSQIPLLDMHFAALRAGVPLLTIEEIRSHPLLGKSFATDERLVTTYNGWLAGNAIGPSSVKTFTRAHTDQYLRWRGALHTDGKDKLKSKRFFIESTPADIKDLAEADSDFWVMLCAWRERRLANATAFGRVTEMAKDLAHLLPVNSGGFTDWGKDPLSESEEGFFTLMTEHHPLPETCNRLFDDYVHDSRAGFRVMSHHEPEWLTGGYARYRHIFFEQTSDDNTYAKANEALHTAKAAAGATVDFFQKLYRFSRDSYEMARQKIDSASQQTVNLAVATGHSIESAAIQGANALSKESEKAYKTAIATANESMRIYDSAQNRVLLRYIKAQKELHRQLHERWSKVSKALDM